MDESDDGFSDFDDVDEPNLNGTLTERGVGGGALAGIETDLGLSDFHKRLSKSDGKKTDSSSFSSSAAKKRKKKKLKEKHLIGDPFAIDSNGGSSASTSSSFVPTPPSGLQQRLLPSTDDENWMRKMGLAGTLNGSSSSPSSASASPVVVSFSNKRKGFSTLMPTSKPEDDDDDDDDKLDLDMERTRLEILKYETQRMKGKKATAAKMKEYLESLGARPAKIGAYRNPEHRQNYVKKKSKTENKERRIRKEMGLKVDNHDERSKKEAGGGKKKRKELGAVSSLGKWSDKTATLKVKKRSFR